MIKCKYVTTYGSNTDMRHTVDVVVDDINTVCEYVIIT